MAADQPRPEVVKDPPPSFRVRRVVHGDPDGLEAELQSAEADGYAQVSTLAQANGDVIVIFKRTASAAAAEA